MEHYKKFEVNDFVWDDDFRQWVLHPTREKHAAWDLWLKGNPASLPAVNQARQIVLSLRIQEKVISPEEVKELVENTLDRVRSQPDTKQVKHTKQVSGRLWAFRIAASILMLLAIGWVASLQKIHKTPATASRTTPSEAIRETSELIEQVNNGAAPMEVALSDGSSITLMKGSKVGYPPHFEDSKREVSLVGEAFFNISKDPERPFIVYAGDLVTRVLGTSFLIRAYPASKESTVEVKTGLVSVSSRGSASATLKNRGETEGVILSPNQKVIFEKNEVRMVKTLVAEPEIITPDISALSFQFEDVPVSEAFAAIAKAYGIEIRYDQEMLADCPLTATLDTQTLREKLSIICLAVEATYEIVDGQIIIHSKGCKN